MVSTDLELRIARRTEELHEAIKQLKDNPRVRDIRVIVRPNACPVCQAIAGTYQKENLPQLPPEGCSCPHGFEGFCQPMLKEIYP